MKEKVPSFCGVYLIQAEHTDGRRAVYIGSTRCVKQRLKEHGRALFNLSTNQTGATCAFNKEISKPEWTKSFHILCNLPNKMHHGFQYFFEFVMMLRSGLLRRGAVQSTRHRPGLIELYQQMKHHAIIYTTEDLNPLNYGSPSTMSISESNVPD